MSTTNNYPLFAADQVLKAEHLNELFDYLDQDHRLTRRCFLGMGIVCGLDIHWSQNTLFISSGLSVKRNKAEAEKIYSFLKEGYTTYFTAKTMSFMNFNKKTSEVSKIMDASELRALAETSK